MQWNKEQTKEIVAVVLQGLLILLLVWLSIKTVQFAFTPDEKAVANATAITGAVFVSDSSRSVVTDSSGTNKTGAAPEASSSKKITTTSVTKYAPATAAKTAAVECTLCAKERFTEAFKYFILLFGVLLILLVLPRLTKFNISHTGVDVTLSEKMEANNKNAGAAVLPEPNVRRDGAMPAGADRNLAAEDPRRGVWGGNNKSNERVLSATVKPKASESDLYEVELKVQSTDFAKPLKGIVQFQLHPNFRNAAPVIFVINGIATLKIFTNRPFIVGAVADEGNTKLELDLSAVEGFVV